MSKGLFTWVSHLSDRVITSTKYNDAQLINNVDLKIILIDSWPSNSTGIYNILCSSTYVSMYVYMSLKNVTIFLVKKNYECKCWRYSEKLLILNERSKIQFFVYYSYVLGLSILCSPSLLLSSLVVGFMDSPFIF